MGDFSSEIAGAIEPPPSRVVPTIGTRRHRPLTGTAGLLLFVCMFMPALKGCSSTPVLPLDVPPFLPPYLYGLVFAIVALARTHQGLAAGVLALRVLGATVAFSGFVVFLVAPAVGIVELTVGLGLLAAIGSRGSSEARIALSVVVMGLVCTSWFALWAMAPDALLGVHLSLASSSGMLLGGLVWTFELWRQPPGNVPTAIVRRC
jgi:hypothetical protein